MFAKLKILLVLLPGLRNLDFEKIGETFLKGSWRTRLSGGLTLLGLVCVLALKVMGIDVDNDVVTILIGVLAAGTYVSRDDKVSSEQAGAGIIKPIDPPIELPPRAPDGGSAEFPSKKV